MISDEKLLEILVQQDSELAKYVEEHRALDQKIADLARQRSLNPGEQLEYQRLKKEKLAGRDKIARILDDYRKNKRAVFDSKD
jgi:uncharacterized protein YdcH (DUF465 family)